MIDSIMESGYCVECGAKEHDGLSCSEQFGYLLVWEHNDPKLYELHFWTVSNYMIQHPSHYTIEAYEHLKRLFCDAYDYNWDNSYILKRNREAATTNKNISMMKVLKVFNGSKDAVWDEGRNYLGCRPILKEAGVEESVTSMKHQIKWHSWIHVVHTGASAEILMAIAEGQSMTTSAKYLSGPAWDSISIMCAAAQGVNEVFGNVDGKKRRAILINIGKELYKILSGIDPVVDTREHLYDSSLRMSFDSYEPLVDVEWIEELTECSDERSE